MANVTRDFIEGVWKVAHDRTSREYPFIQFALLVKYVLQQFPSARPIDVQAALEELAESGRIDAREGFCPTSEIEVMRRYP